MPEIITSPKSGTNYRSGQVLEIVDHFLYTATNGILILTIQDGYIVKIERTEKYLITTKNRTTGYIKYGKPATAHPLRKKIVSEMQQIQYGQLVIRLNNGKVEQIERTEKRRVSDQENLYGAGI